MDLSEFTGTWDYTVLPANVRIGEGCFLQRKESFARFRSQRDPGLTLGRSVSVYTWTAFSVEPSGVIEVGDDSVLVGVQLMCAESIRLGQRVIVSYNVMIADCGLDTTAASTTEACSTLAWTARSRSAVTVRSLARSSPRIDGS